MKSQNGFTLIELVIVIVLLGVLAAIAVPRFINLEDDAREAQLNATAAAITSAMNINFAGCAVNGHATGPDCVAVDNCDDAISVLSNGPALIRVDASTAEPFSTNTAAITGGPGTTLGCTLTLHTTTPASTASFTAVRAGP